MHSGLNMMQKKHKTCNVCTVMTKRDIFLCNHGALPRRNHLTLGTPMVDQNQGFKLSRAALHSADCFVV